MPDRVTIVVDKENWESALNKVSKNGHTAKIDYNNLWNVLTGGRECIGIYYYTLREEPENPFFRFLKATGVNVRAAQTLGYHDIDEAIITQLPELAATADTVILLSGDGDFLPMLDGLVAQGKQVEIVAASAMIYGEYFDRAAYTVVNLESFIDQIKTDEVRLRPRESRMTDEVYIKVTGEVFTSAENRSIIAEMVSRMINQPGLTVDFLIGRPTDD